MLKIWLGDFQKGCIKNPNRYFNLHKKKEWFDRLDVKEIIKTIDDTDVVDGEYLKSPVFGGYGSRKIIIGL